jgi:hypothetical protein
MPGLGIGIAFAGYWIFYYGLTQVNGFNFGFLYLGIPGRWATAQSTPKDSGGAGGAPSLANTNPSTSSGSAQTGTASGVPGNTAPVVTPGGAGTGNIGTNPYTGPGAV